jgi:hypothetical protein
MARRLVLAIVLGLATCFCTGRSHAEIVKPVSKLYFPRVVYDGPVVVKGGFVTQLRDGVCAISFVLISQSNRPLYAVSFDVHLMVYGQTREWSGPRELAALLPTQSHAVYDYIDNCHNEGPALHSVIVSVKKWSFTSPTGDTPIALTVVRAEACGPKYYDSLCLEIRNDHPKTVRSITVHAWEDSENRIWPLITEHSIASLAPGANWEQVVEPPTGASPPGFPSHWRGPIRASAYGILEP